MEHTHFNVSHPYYERRIPNFSVPVTEESVNTLRHRLNAMKGILDDEDPKSVSARKKAARKRAGRIFFQIDFIFQS